MRSSNPNILKRHIIEHLCKVDRSKLGKPRRSVHIYIKECNKNFPRNNPICAVILFGEEDYFLTKKQRAILLQTGGDSKYFTKPRIKDFCQTTDKTPPSAGT
jgi:hypothetical protein